MTPKHIPKDKVIPEEEYNKLKFQFQGTQSMPYYKVFDCYGLGL